MISAILLTTSFLLKQNLHEAEIASYLKANDLSFVLKNTDGTENSLIKDTREMLEKIGVPNETIENVMNSEATKEFMSQYITDVLFYLIYGEEKTTSITIDNIKTLAKENFNVIEETLSAKGLTFTEEQKTKMNRLIDEYAIDIMNFFPTANVLLGKLNQSEVPFYKNITLKDITSMIALMTSNPYILSLIAILMGSGLIIIFCNFKQRKTWHYFKLATLSYAFFLIFVEILLGTVVKNTLMLKLESAKEFINYMVNALSKNIWLFILIALLLSIIFAKLEKGRKKNAPILERLYQNDERSIKEESNEK